MERSGIPDALADRFDPGFRFTPSGLRLTRLPVITLEALSEGFGMRAGFLHSPSVSNGTAVDA